LFLHRIKQLAASLARSEANPVHKKRTATWTIHIVPISGARDTVHSSLLANQERSVSKLFSESPEKNTDCLHFLLAQAGKTGNLIAGKTVSFAWAEGEGAAGPGYYLCLFGKYDNRPHTVNLLGDSNYSIIHAVLQGHFS
jgi:hypothetical protein